jgi:hypothetical protein
MASILNQISSSDLNSLRTYTVAHERYYVRQIGPIIDRAKTSLLELPFIVPEIKQLLLRGADDEIIYRQAAPYCFVTRRYFPKSSFARRLAGLQVFMLHHSLVLNNVDRFFDPFDKENLRAPSHKLLSNSEALALALVCWQHSNILAKENHLHANYLSALSRITDSVVQNMYFNHISRFRLLYIRRPDMGVQDYRLIGRSRHFGSCFYESSGLAPFFMRGRRPPRALQMLLHSMRRMRQMVDEIADFREDLVSGLVTWPLLCRLKKTPQRRVREVEKHIGELWSYVQALRKSESDFSIANRLDGDLDLAKLLQRVYETIDFDLMMQEAYDATKKEIYCNYELLVQTVGDPSTLGNSYVDRFGIFRLIESKMIFLERLRRQKWDNLSVTPSYRTTIRRWRAGRLRQRIT